MPLVESPALDLRTKRCRRCGRDKPWREFYAAKKWPDGTMRAPHSRCKKCSNAIRHQQRRNSPTQWARWLELNRTLKAEARKDPEWAATLREYQRTYYRTRNGVTPDRYRVDMSGPAGGRELDTAPFAAWLRTLGRTAGQIGLACGLNERQVRAYLDGERPTVYEDVVDRALLDFPLRLEDLYPDIYSLEEAS